MVCLNVHMPAESPTHFFSMKANRYKTNMDVLINCSYFASSNYFTCTFTIASKVTSDHPQPIHEKYLILGSNKHACTYVS